MLYTIIEISRSLLILICVLRYLFAIVYIVNSYIACGNISSSKIYLSKFHKWVCHHVQIHVMCTVHKYTDTPGKYKIAVFAQ